MRTQRSAIGRRGDWIQIFMILFFFLLLCVALALFFLEKDALETVRPELRSDLNHHKSAVVLQSVLRMPYEKDVDGNGVLETITFAQAISLGMTEDELGEFLRESLPQDVPYLISLQYEGRDPVEIDHIRTLSAIERIVRFTGTAEDMIKQRTPRATVELPRASVSMIYADDKVLDQLLGYMGTQQRTETIAAIKEQTRTQTHE